jgi:copper transport protein
VLVVALGALAPGAAAAHAVLVSTAPADRTAIAEPLSEVTLRFNEPVDPVAVRLIAGDGRSVGVVVTAANETVRVVPQAPLVSGAYILSWRVISADAHPVAGALQFAVGEASPSWRADPLANGTATGWQPLAIANRAVQLIALCLAVGGALYGVWIGAAPQRLVLWAAAVGATTALFAVGIEGVLALEAPPEALLGGEPWLFGAGTSRGLASAAVILGLALLAMRQVVAATALVVVSFALSGHAATAPPRLLSVPALLIHAGFAMLWVGAFVPLRWAGSGDGPRSARVFRWGLPALVVAGLCLAVVQVRDWSPLIDTGYGVTLLFKVAMVAALITLVLRSRSRYRRTAVIACEMALACAVLVTTAILTQTPPPRSAASAPFIASVTSGKLIATVSVSPAVVGRNAVSVIFADPAGSSLTPREVEAHMSNPSAGIEPIVRPLVRGPDGIWRHEGPELAIAGEWVLRVEALVGDFERAAVDVRVPVRGSP